MTAHEQQSQQTKVRVMTLLGRATLVIGLVLLMLQAVQLLVP